MKRSQQLHILDRVAESGKLEQLKQLGDPIYLGMLFQLRLLQVLKTGPKAAIKPAELLACAIQAANQGLVGMHTIMLIRGQLTRLSSELQGMGIQGAWWEPIHETEGWETQWLQWDREFQRLNKKEVDTLRDHRLPVVVREAFLSESLLPKVAQEFQDAVANGVLELQRAGVGADERISDQRSDVTTYINGLEPKLLEKAPMLCMLVQWLRARMPMIVRDAVDAPVFAPGGVMLARYFGSSAGYAPHMDNASGDNNNGRRMTLTLYLNKPEHRFKGGQLTVWERGELTTAEPALRITPKPGLAVLFPSADVPHQVEPLGNGPDRWSLAMWMNDTPQEPILPPLPRLKATDLLPNWRPLPLQENQIAFHLIGTGENVDEICLATPNVRPMVGIVTTLYRAGAEIFNFCEHHLGVGVEAIYLIYDHAEEPEEADWMARVSEAFAGRVHAFAGSELAKRYGDLPEDPRLEKVRRVAEYKGSSQAVAARQMLNASVILRAIQAKQLHPVDWLIHIDADELVHMSGPDRGGFDLPTCFAGAEYLGFNRLRFLNDERLAGVPEEMYKVNPAVAAAQMGSRGWQEMVDLLNLSQDGPRPWFHAYHNGKSAVKVNDGYLAAGVHGWYLKDGVPEASVTLAGPIILHNLFHDPDYFVTKYMNIAANPIPQALRLFQPAPLEMRLVELVQQSQDPAQALSKAYKELTHFNEQELSLLKEARLLWEL